MIESLARSSRLLPLLRGEGRAPRAARRAEEARVAFDQAIALANTAAEAAHIRLHLDRLMKEKFASG